MERAKFGRREWGGRVCAVLLMGILLTGCSRAVVQTDVKADGSWKRTVKFYGNEPGKEATPLTARLEDQFALPNGSEWKVRREKKGENEIIVTAERSLLPEAKLERDVAVLGGKDKAKKPVLTNSVSVKQISPGRFEYREVLHWTGGVPKDLQKLNPELLAAINSTLPKSLATPQNSTTLAQDITKELWQVMLGPSDPLLSQLVMHPDLASRRIMARVGKGVYKALETTFGDKLTPDARLDVTRRMMTLIIDKTTETSKAKTQPESANNLEDGAGMAALTFAVKLPGKIVSSNGEVDPLTNEVFWALYAEAAAIGDVTLTAVCDTNK